MFVEPGFQWEIWFFGRREQELRTCSSATEVHPDLPGILQCLIVPNCVVCGIGIPYTLLPPGAPSSSNISKVLNLHANHLPLSFLGLLFLTVLTCLKKDRRMITVQIPIWDGQRLQGTSCTLRHAATLSAGCYSVGRYPAASQCELEGLPVIQDAGRKMAGPKRGKICSSFRFKNVEKLPRIW